MAIFDPHLEKAIKQERENEGIIRNYLMDNKSNYVKPKWNVPRQILPPGAISLSANNSSARIRFMQIAHGELEMHFSAMDRRLPQRAFFVTLTPSMFAMREFEASQFNPKNLKRWIKDRLQGHNYIGAIEAAHYPRLRMTDESGGIGTISWHAHVIVWHTTRKKLEAQLSLKCLDDQSLLARIPAYHIKNVLVKRVGERLLYALKSPQNQYVQWGWQEAHTDTSGNKTFNNLPRFQKKAKLRPGQRITMCNVLRHQYLDKLLVSGGDGQKVHRNIVKKTLRAHSGVRRAAWPV